MKGYMSMISFLARSDVQTTLDAYKDETDFLALRRRLAGMYSQEEAIAISRQIALRQRAQRKFPSPQHMLFDCQGLQQATHAAVAVYNASFFTKSDKVVDACCGIGSDLIALSKNVDKVFAVESDPERTACSRFNLESLGKPDTVTFCEDDILSARLPDSVTGMYADPSRRREGRRRNDPEDYAPPLSALIQKAKQELSATCRLIVKLSPVCDYESLLSLGRIEVVSLDSEVKEILFIRDGRGAGRVKAVLLTHENFLPESFLEIESDPAVSKKVSPVQDYILEPDPAIIRAGLVAEYADLIGASFIDSQIAYLTSRKPGQEKGARAYAVEETYEYNPKKLKKILQAKGLDALTVKKRGTRESARTIQDKLGIKSGSNTRFLFVFRRGTRHWACLARREWREGRKK